MTTAAEALAATLAAEHAAVYVYAVLGGRISASAAPDAAALIRDAYDTHLERRDRLRGVMADLGEDPVPAAAAYAVDALNRSARHLVAVARATEGTCAEVYAQQVAATTGELRRWAVEALVDSSVRQLRFDGQPTAFPGLSEL